LTEKNLKLPGTRGPARKLYLPIFTNKYRVIGLIDFGVDITIMQETLYHKIIPYENGTNNKLQPSDIDNIYSFSNYVVPILGRSKMLVCLSHNHPGFFYIFMFSLPMLTFQSFC
jgi:hypothetical protein